MTKTPFILTIILLISSCDSMTKTPSGPIPEMMQPDWTGVEIDDFPVKFGQILKFTTDSIDLTGIVLDFSEDEGGQWFGICFIDQNRLFGRQVPSGMINTTCLNLLDLTYIQKNALIEYEVIKLIPVNKSKVGIGSRRSTTSLNEIKRSFNQGIEQRKKEQIACDNGITDLNPVRECYFEIEKIKK